MSARFILWSAECEVEQRCVALKTRT